MIWKATSLDEYSQIAEKLFSKYPDQRIFLFHGDMGAGKTTFIKQIIHYLGSEDKGSSPTFGIVNEYSGVDSVIYHFDCYRLKSEEEAESIGWFDYLDSGSFCLIEWPERVESILPEEFVLVKIQNDNGERIISAEKINH